MKQRSPKHSATRRSAVGLCAGLCVTAGALLLHAHQADAGPIPARALPHGASLARVSAAIEAKLPICGKPPADHDGGGGGTMRACQDFTRRTRAPEPAPPPTERTYRVRSGDNWELIALRHNVEREQLLAWNPDVGPLYAKTELSIEVPRNFEPTPAVGLALDRDPSGLPLVPVPEGGESRGHASRGRLRHGVRMPENPSLYTIRRPRFAYGSSHTVRHLQLAIAKFRAHSEYDGPLIVSDMSRRRGGTFAHHNSHQSGRDVDIWLPLRAEVVQKRLGQASVPEREADAPAINYWDLGALRPRDVDWQATLELVKALVRTAEVRYIFLSRSRQRHLYRAARDAGLAKDILARLIEFPMRDRSSVVRHAPSHTAHMHVRFRCAPDETRCY